MNATGWYACGLVAVCLWLTGSPVVAGGNPNTCDEPGDEPDVIVGNIHNKDRWGTSGGITSFSIATTSCNVGTCWLNWFSGGSNQHPVIGQNMFRLMDGRFEHIGQSWLKHGFFALSQEFCSPDCIPTNGNHLGVNCSDPYSAFLNGQQSNLGPKFEVNASTGYHPHPVTDGNLTGNVIFKRLQVHNTDLDPALNPDALYFVEAQYVTEDDSAAGNQNNNASYRKVVVSGSGSFFDFSFDGPTQQELPGIRAWSDFDVGVQETYIDVPGDGRFILANKVTDLGNGMWHYEYAIQNLNSHRSAMSFTVPIPNGATVTNIGFHDVDYHSGEPQSNQDWADNGGSGFQIQWFTDSFTVNPDANALRWGTLYNFRFDIDVPPAINDVTLGLFLPGLPAEMKVETLTPTVCNADGICDPGENCELCEVDCADGVCAPGEDACNCAVDCGAPPSETCDDEIDNDCDQLPDCFDVDCCAEENCAAPDDDFDTYIGCADCDESNGSIWSAPGPVWGLTVAKGEFGTVFTWAPPEEPGGDALTYEVLRSRFPANFVLSTNCLSAPDPSTTSYTETMDPAVGLWAYLVRATNDCPQGTGALGSDSGGEPRQGRTCP